MQEIEATLRQSARSTKGLMEAARILSTLKMATSQAHTQNSAEHASNTAFAEGVAQQAEQRVQHSSDRHRQHLHNSNASHRPNAGICYALPACMTVRSYFTARPLCCTASCLDSFALCSFELSSCVTLPVPCLAPAVSLVHGL